MTDNLKLINGLLRLLHIFGAVIGANSWRVKCLRQPLDLVISEHITVVTNSSQTPQVT